ncbi:MAG TPA: hypothetical protein DHK64_00045, partial [Rhodobiaceae bacterium]|nr:hypothetical protein [Rhodobiaceae bacterium]
MEFLFALVFFATPFIVWWGFRYMRRHNTGRGTSLAGGLGLGFVTLVVAGALFLDVSTEDRANVLEEDVAAAGSSADVAASQVLPTPSRGLGVSHRAILDAMAGDFVSENSTPVDGQPRRLAQAKNGLALLETIGDARDVHSATLILFVPNDSPRAVLENTTYGVIFTKTTLPDWPDASNWFSESILKISEGDVDEQEVSREGV